MVILLLTWRGPSGVHSKYVSNFNFFLVIFFLLKYVFFFLFFLFFLFSFFHTQPYFGRFRLDTTVEHLIGPASIPPIARPIEMTSVPDSVTSFRDMSAAMRSCLTCCTLLANQDDIVKNSYCLRAALVQHLFTHVIPLPLAMGHPKKKMRCFWERNSLARDTQSEIFHLLHLLTRHYGAVTMSLKVTRSFDGARIVTLACIASIADALLRKVASDFPSELSLHYAGKVGAPMCTPFYVDTNAFAAESSCLKFVEPELVTCRCMVLDYFHSLRTSTNSSSNGGASVLFKFVGGVGLGQGEELLLRRLCVHMGYPCNDVHAVGKYLSGENRALIDVYPELGFFRDINFMLRLLMVPSNEHLPRVTKWKSTDAELTWSYVAPKGKGPDGEEVAGTFHVVGFQNRVMSWKADSKRESQSSEIKDETIAAANAANQNRGFLTRLFLGKGKRVGRAPSSLANPSHLVGKEILDEEDVLHVDKLPTFGGRLPAQQCEVLLQFLTVPYLRIPLVSNWFSQPLQVMLLNVPELQETLDACLFEPGVWSPNTSKAAQVPLSIPPNTFDHMVTPCGLLFQELTTSPKVLCTAMEDMMIQAIEMDTGTWSSATSEVLLYIVRLVVRVEGFIDLILERARIDDDEEMEMVEEKEKEEEEEEKEDSNDHTNGTITNTTKRRSSLMGVDDAEDAKIDTWSAACCARGLDVPMVDATAEPSTTDDPVDILRHARQKLRSLLDHRVMYILERWCNNAMKVRDMAIASKLHAHLAFLQKNRLSHEYRPMSVSILLIAQMFLTSRVQFEAGDVAESEETKNGGNNDSETSLVHQLGIPQTEIFDMFQQTRGDVAAWLRDHPNEKDEIMEAVVRVVTLTGTRKQSHDNDTTEDRGDDDTAREWIELSLLNKFGLTRCQGRWVPMTEHGDVDKDEGRRVVPGETYEDWLRRTMTEVRLLFSVLFLFFFLFSFFFFLFSFFPL